MIHEVPPEATSATEYLLSRLRAWAAGEEPSEEELDRLAVWAEVAQSELRALASEREAAREILLEARDVIHYLGPDGGKRVLRLVAEHERLAASVDALLRLNAFNAERGKSAPVKGAPGRSDGSLEKALRLLAEELDRHSPRVPTREKPLPPNVKRFRRRR